MPVENPSCNIFAQRLRRSSCNLANTTASVVRHQAPMLRAERLSCGIGETVLPLHDRRRGLVLAAKRFGRFPRGAVAQLSPRAECRRRCLWRSLEIPPGRPKSTMRTTAAYFFEYTAGGLGRRFARRNLLETMKLEPSPDPKQLVGFLHEVCIQIRNVRRMAGVMGCQVCLSVPAKVSMRT